MTNILVTGGLGYIGSHVCVSLIEAGYGVVVYDDFSNSEPSVVDRIGTILGRVPEVVEGDERHLDGLRKLFQDYTFHAVIHMAGKKSVAENTCADPSF